jgi:ribonuclease P protein component
LCLNAAEPRAGINYRPLTRKSPIKSPQTSAFDIDGVSERDIFSIEACVSFVGGGFFRFRPGEHLKKRNEIREVFSKGKRIALRGVKLFILKNCLPHNRICFTLSRGYGNAVERNRAKRLGREAYRHLKPRLSFGYDFILLLYPELKSGRLHAESATDLKSGKSRIRKQVPGFAKYLEQLENLFTMAGLLA